MPRITRCAAVTLMIIMLITDGPLNAETMKIGDLDLKNLKLSDYNLGLQFWFSWWDPVIKNYLNGKGNRMPSFRNSLSRDRDYTFILGPAFTARLSGRWGIAGVFMFGLTQYQLTGNYIGTDLAVGVPVEVFLQTNTMKVNKFDFDLMIDYKLNGTFKLFGGIKSQVYHGAGRGLRITASQVLPSSDDYLIFAMGPGLGVSATHHLGEGFFLLGNLSLLNLFGDYQLERRYLQVFRNWYHTSYGAAGLNMAVSIAYFAVSTRVTTSLGYRYQFLGYYGIGGSMNGWDVNYRRAWIDGQMDHFHGLMLTVVYSF